MATELSFAGNALNAVDAKGRVSVPAAFRARIAERQQANGRADDRQGGTLMIMPHRTGHRLLAYDQVGADRLSEDLAGDVADLPAAERREALDTLRGDMLGNMLSVPYDGAGRMVLPGSLRKCAEIGDQAYFRSAGTHFEIWGVERARTGLAANPMALYMLESHLQAREA